MILSFSIYSFPYDILHGRINGKKIHTIRRDKKKRWKVGMKIHFWQGSPRFRGRGSYPFGTGVVKSVEGIKIDFRRSQVIRAGIGEFSSQFWLISLYEDIQHFAHCEGFENWEEFKSAFQTMHPGDVFEGRLITWEQPVTPL